MVFAARKDVISGGNFHGEYPAKVRVHSVDLIFTPPVTPPSIPPQAMDYLAIGVHELANMSERRQERLINPAYSDLPAFLVEEGGINSGFMLAHCTSASLGKGLTTSASPGKGLTLASPGKGLATSASGYGTLLQAILTTLGKDWLVFH